MTTHTHEHAANHHDVAIGRSHAHNIHVGQCNTGDAILAGTVRVAITKYYCGLATYASVYDYGYGTHAPGQ